MSDEIKNEAEVVAEVSVDSAKEEAIVPEVSVEVPAEVVEESPVVEPSEKTEA